MARANEETGITNRDSVFQRIAQNVSLANCQTSLRWSAVAICLCCNAAVAEEVTSELIPTMSYERSVPIKANGEAINLGHHAVPRCYDWDQDGDVDLLVGG